MKFLLSKMLFSLGVLLSIMSTSHAIPLVRDGKAVAKIYVAPLSKVEATTKSRTPLPTPALATAVSELNYHLQKMSGATLEVVETTDATQVKAPGVVLGELAVRLGAIPQKTTVSQEGFRLLSKGELLLIGGQSDEAVLFGVYEGLRKLGCDWVMPGEIGEIIPQKNTVVVPALDESQAPDFSFRQLTLSGRLGVVNTKEDLMRHDVWMRRQKSGSYHPPTLDTQGHAWDAFIHKHKAEFEKDPTMYALVRDASGQLQRKGPQIETTHPRVIELFVQDIKDTFEQKKWPSDKEAGFRIGPADGLGYSLSSESQLAGAGRINPITGDADETDTLVLLANKILERVEKTYPNVWLGFYSYSWHGDYPARYKPHPRLVQIFAPISFSRFHSILDPNSKTQEYYREVVEQWGKLSREQGNPLIYRGYNWNLAENLLPYTKLKIWGEELPYYKSLGFIGLRVEANRLWSITGPSDYVMMRLAWDTSQDWKQILREYCRHSFGAGWQPMEEYLLRLVDTQHGAGHEAGSYHAFPLIYDDAFVAAAERNFSEAKRLAQKPEEKLRVDYIATGVEALKRYLNYFRATTAFDFAAAKKHYDSLLAQHQHTYELNRDLTTVTTKRYLDRYITSFVEQSNKYSEGDYKLVQPLPDEMLSMLDPTVSGQRMRYQSMEINDKGFTKTKTYSTTWDAQGLTGVRSGAVWYRHRFTLPANLKGQPIGLFLGGFEDEARVWINGQPVGTSGRGFSKPAAFDLTDGLKYEGENLLAIQIVRSSGANELGLGGIIRPSFLFTGPRLETKAPKPMEQRRVLPGGELGEIEK